MLKHDVPISFKTDHEKAQFDLRGRDGEGNGFNPRARAIALEMAYFSWRYFGKTLVITNVLGGNEKSPHSHGNAFDVRSTIYNLAEAEILKDHINKNFPYRSWNPFTAAQTCIIHDVGKGIHFHIQVGKP